MSVQVFWPAMLLLRRSCQLRRTSVWVCALAMLIGSMTLQASAQDTAETAAVAESPAVSKSPAPIELKPERGTAAPVVQLKPGKQPEPWSPLEIGDFTLLDQNGQTVTAADLRGKPWVASFIFTKCAFACPNLVKKIYDLNRQVQDVDVRFVTITVDPEYDTVAKMKQYADIYEATPERWLFLTGEKGEVYRLIRHGFKVAAWETFGTERLPGFEFAHSLSLVHVGADGKVLGMYASGNENEIQALQRVLEGKIETPPENRPAPPAAVPEGQAPAFIKPPATSKTGRGSTGRLPDWAARLPATNAMLNALATVLLLVGFSAVKARRIPLHKRMMLLSFAVSVVFLASYLTYHFTLQKYTGTHGRKFDGDGIAKTIYYAILITHVSLAATVPVLAPLTIYRGLKQDWIRHRRIARITFPIWLYVSITGVIIYGMLYHWPVR
jgi:protein SCO1/2/putative membrane protein